MKKNLFFISLMALTVLFSCKKDDTSPYDVKYTNEPVEETKSNVEQNAVDMVDKLDELSSATAFEVLINLNGLESGDIYASNPVMAPLSYLAKLDNKSDVTSVFETMKATATMLAEEPFNFSDAFYEETGKYTWNKGTKEFDKTELDDEIIIEFPGKETDPTNTATLTISNFSVTEITDPMEDWPENVDTELPSSINIDLKYLNASVAGTSLVATYQNNGMPTKVELSVYVDDFTFTTTALHTPYSSASWTNTLTLDSDILFETYIAAKGNWSEENIEDNTEEMSDDYDEWTEVHFEEILKNANAHVILMNLKVLGTVDLKTLGDAMWALDTDESITDEEEYTKALVEIINANAKLIVIYRDSNTKLASVEAYVESEYDSYWEETEYYAAMRFVYADGSKVSVEDFADDNLDDFYTAINDFIDKLNDEYDIDLDRVYPPSDY